MQYGAAEQHVELELQVVPLQEPGVSQRPLVVLQVWPDLQKPGDVLQFGRQMPSAQVLPSAQGLEDEQEGAQTLEVPMVAQVAPSPQVAEVEHGLLHVPTVEPEGMLHDSDGSTMQSAIDLHGLPSSALAVPPPSVPPPSLSTALSLGQGEPSPQGAKPLLVVLEHPLAKERRPMANPIKRLANISCLPRPAGVVPSVPAKRTSARTRRPPDLCDSTGSEESHAPSVQGAPSAAASPPHPHGGPRATRDACCARPIT